MADPETSSAVAANGTKKVVKRKPARKQVEHGQVEKKQPEQTGQTYNIWYNKWAGGDRFDSYNVKEKSQTRCDIKRDSGYTRADAAVGKPGGELSNAYCCLFFARGCCPYGSECTYLHRLPLPATKLPDSSLDCFGREKFSDYRDDMGGVGSFTRQNRTVYVGRIAQTRNTEEIVERHFSEWGEIERIKILQSRGVAFVTYVSELNGQFAKEAMMCQSLDNDEILNVRWATEDPNPAAKVQEKRRLVELGEEGIAKKLTPEFVDAVRELDALEKTAPDWGPGTEEGLRILGRAPPSQDDQDRGAKRARLEAPTPAAPPPLPKATGLLSADALQSLQYVADLRKQQMAAPSKPSGLGSLAAYGSDDEE